MRSRIVIAAVAVFVAIAACLLWAKFSRARARESAGVEIHSAGAADVPHRAVDVIAGRRPLDASRWKELLGNEDESLDFGEGKIEWSSAGLNGGYLYFHEPGFMPRRMLWELAPCAAKTLNEVTAQTAAREFFRADSAEGARAFGVDWKGQNVFVEKGDIVLARMISQTNTVYAVQILEQFGEIGQQVRVGYRKIPLGD